MEQETLWSHEVALAADVGSAAKARAFVVHHLVEHRLLYLVDEVRLVASELATNAVVQGQAAFTVILEGREHSVLLTVRGAPQTTRAPSHAAPHEPGVAGLGRVIVNLMSEDWGTAGEDGATRSVWASFEVRPRAVP
jgi:hypothetical protein